ncbi:putative leucine aminopeptidase 1 [Orchesella cincta]|uniref:Putative leucine aminopeptidase 1 n=1 Tax=Orchesella cincta TaxID=48709 RepID=A0A1D2MHV4_ORCCI|nr:putative leucine aminopeptidase 1 [Orchesella cincta]
MKFFQLLLVASVGVILVSSRAVEQEGKRLIKTSEEDPGQWMDENEIFDLIKAKKTFIDITDSDFPEIKPEDVNIKAIPTTLRFQEIVRDVLTNLNSQRIEDFVREFSSYHNRYYAAQTGRDSQLWLLSQVESSIQGYAGSASVVEVDHGYIQKSIVARLEGADPTLKSEVIVLGAHLDSINIRGSSLQAPGADDNGSGSVTILETLREIVESQVVLNRTVEFQWYAAEEIGLRGSQAIAQAYRRDNVNIIGMLNLDVVGYYVNGVDDIGIYTDNGNAQMAQFLRILTDEYLEFGRRDLTCGYGCSDHASFTNAGFPAVMAGEAVDHPGMHTVTDVLENMSIRQVNEFVKLSVGLTIEMGEPNRP